jgi:hypothetical protein
MTHDSTPPDPPGIDSSDPSYLIDLDRPAQSEDLATELYTIIRQALARLGVADGEQSRSFERASTLHEPPHASGAVMRSSWGLSNLIGEWSRAPEYQDADGQPRILKLKGAGASFATLAKRFLPGVPLQEVIDLARRSAEVELLPRSRIALLGSVLVKTTTAREVLLAHAIRHIDQLLKTILHNEMVHSGLQAPEPGRMERMVVGIMRKDRFEDFMAEFRPQVFNFMSQVDAGVERRAPTSREEIKDATAVVVTVYVAQESDWGRIGVDPETMISSSA